ncbi:ABC transporter permease [Microbulbifer sp. TRSA002]|uniref:ABC transporter permease n=1 Tax=Microbulbifer sp. TRSA002 TaxID=3243382 RepID=UPI00403A7312
MFLKLLRYIGFFKSPSKVAAYLNILMLKNHLNIVWLRGVNALKADIEKSYLGTVWWLLEPLLLTALFYLAFSTGLRGQGHEGGFLTFLLCAMLPYKWTASCLTTSSDSIVNNKGILGQFYLPKWIFPSAVNLSMTIRFIMVLPILFGALLWSGYSATLVWINIIPIILSQLILNLGISFLAAATVPLIPDLRHLIPIATTGILFTSGVFFDINTRPESIQTILWLNPFSVLFDSYRSALLHSQSISAATLFYPFMFGIFLLAISLLILKKLDRTYPRVLV